MTTKTDRLRRSVVGKIRRLRLDNRWTQTRLARLLGLSQNRLSEIERGKGSFTAEQLLLILKTFNTPLHYFSMDPPATDEKILQNAIARMGAGSLRESGDLLPTEKLENSVALIREVLSASTSPRQITALAPILVDQPNLLGLNKLWLEFVGEGRINRLGWLFDSVRLAIENELESNHGKIPADWANRYHRAEVLLKNVLKYPGFSNHTGNRKTEDPLEPEVLQSQESFEETKSSRDPVAKKWGMVTRIRTNDFIHVLRETRENH